MLYEFHRKQNAKKPGSVHATYLITGTRHLPKPESNGVHSQDDEDTVMQSSPPLPSSSMPRPAEAEEEKIPRRSILLVKEEHLDKAKQTFESITGIHIYSLQADGLSDVQGLTECNRKVASSYASEDPLKEWKQYGTIQNPNVKRRTRRTAPPPAAPIANNAEVKTKPLAPTTKPTVLEKQASKESQSASNKPTPEPEKDVAASKKGSITKPTATKRQNSDIFKSFAKGKPKPKKEDSQASVETMPAPEPEDTAMAGFSDDEPLEDGPEEPVEQVNMPSGKTKDDRQAELEAMMDKEDEPMEDSQEGTAETPKEDSESEKADQQPNEEPKETVTVENGRRRGRRRIMKKKTVKDEEGYLGKCNVCYRII